MQHAGQEQATEVLEEEMQQAMDRSQVPLGAQVAVGSRAGLVGLLLSR